MGQTEQISNPRLGLQTDIIARIGTYLLIARIPELRINVHFEPDQLGADFNLP